MIKKIIISRLNNIAAIIQQNKVQELIVINEIYQINDIYLGSVQKVFTAINAAFIKLNKNEKSGFIHISDIKYTRKLQYTYNITNSITVNQLLLVQIIKEPTKNKGPRLTTNIHLTGQYLILMPFNNIISIDNRIYDENERSYLNSLGILIKPTTMGLLFKESSKGMREETLIEDLRKLKKQWNFVIKSAIYQRSPVLIYKDEDILKKIIRDSYETNITQIVIDSKDGFRRLCCFFHQKQIVFQSKIPKLQLYQRQQCILDKFNINNAVIKALNPKVDLELGGYLFIESSEALTIIDVNSGSFNQSKNSKETILKTNCLAASEIAYQLKIRNINGVIIVDFIDMKTHKDQLKLLKHFTTVLKTDNARPHIVQLSELGLVELTRKRKGRSILELFYNRQDHLSTQSTGIISQINSCLDHDVTTQNFNVNSIFFKRRLKRNLNIKCSIFNLTPAEIFHVTLFPLSASLIIPIYLYHSITGQIAD